jgi:hypothetical protein
MRSRWECETQLAFLKCHVDRPYPPSHVFTCLILMWGELYILNEPFYAVNIQHANFPTRSLGCLELFSSSPLRILGRLSWGPASCLTNTRTIWSEWTHAWWSPLSYLSFERLWPPLLRSSLHPDHFWEPSDLSGLDQNIPPWPTVKSPLVSL